MSLFGFKSGIWDLITTFLIMAYRFTFYTLFLGRRRFPWELESSKTAKMKERELDEEADMNMPRRTAKSDSRFTKNKPKDIDELEKEEARDRADKVGDLGRFRQFVNYSIDIIFKRQIIH